MSKAATRREKLAELRALRASGQKATANYKVADVDDLYEEVNDEQYKKLIRDRLDQDDFVVDDNGEGYADDGREEWDREPAYESDSQSDGGHGARGKDNKSKKKREDDTAKRDANDRDISEFFKKGVSKAPAKPKVIKTEEDDKFLADLLGEVDANIPAPTRRVVPQKRDRSAERRKARDLSPVRETRRPVTKRPKVVDDRLPSPTADDTYMGDMGDDDFPQMDDLPSALADVPMSDPAPSSPAAKAASRRIQPKPEADDDEDENLMEVAHTGAVATASVNITATRQIKKTVKPDPYPTPVTSSPAKVVDPEVDAASWNNINQRLNVVSSTPTEARTAGKMDYKDAVEEDGSLNMFWTDYTEVNGSLCLFGKVLNKKTGSYVSCFVKVDNILRKLYFLPRQHKFEYGEESNEQVEFIDVYNEVDAIMTKMNVGMHKIKKTTRKYAFELQDVPREADYLKLLYPYSKPALDMNLQGETFSRVFGTNTALFEQFVLWKNIMGPCWLKIEDADFGSLKNASHCRMEVLVEHPNMITAISEAESPSDPPLTLMSLAMRTVFNAKDNKQEILAISARIYEDVNLSDPTPADKLRCRTFTLLRPNGTAFPVGFENLVKERKGGLIKLMKQESEMLSFFLAQIDVVDPDVILGHQLEGVDYSVLLNRLYERKAHQWSRLGRFRRTTWPAAIGKVGGNVFAERQVMSGRLLCDLANDAGKSVMFKCQSWTLTEMCNLYLSDEDRRRDVDNDAALKTWATTKKGLMDYVSHVETDTYFIAALALRTQILPLTKVLTNLAGNSWARTLTGTRAERNEYILLHRFHKNKFICPDKQTFRGRQTMENQDEEGGDSKKKDKFKGGLVFEPEKGLYDKFVLVMDFNSLYPSIIQEFNICFTTVDRTKLSDDDDAVPEVPDKNIGPGILPELIAGLVNRRRAVKKLMKDKNATPEELSSWDIKQLALKLTANSMYGCLGYTKSRFYARPLAVLTTYKGREILRSTKELAESKFLQVIYGDTDSVMINANVDNIADALKVGEEFKKSVNDCYRLLEIDIDNVFRRILLQAKKKYAAINMVESNGKWIEKMEVKGLDMRRREYCALSKEISKRTLDEILSGDDTEVSIQRIHEYLREMAAKMRENAIPAQKYIIFTQLGKALKDYPNSDSMPQVQVGLREQARGKTVRKGDVISYIITGDSKASSEPPAKRAYPSHDVVKPNSDLTPDIEWYIGKQIFPTVERLCANIVGTSTAQIAECLGLDIRRFASTSGSSSNPSGPADLEVHPLESQIPDAVRFADCVRLSLRCRACKASAPFEGLLGPPERISAAGVVCPTCAAVLPTLSVVAQVETAIRALTARYYEGWLVCDDASCGNRTRQISVAGARCLGPKGLARDCSGKMRYEVGEREMYNQLVYFVGLWDVDKARAKADEPVVDGEGGTTMAGPERKERILALAEQNRVRFGTLKGVVDKYLDKCGRQWVAMDTLFGRLGFVAEA